MKKIDQGRARRVLTHEQVQYVLESAGSDRAIAKELGVVHVVISNIRNGKTYGELFPELPRRTNVRCAKCQHWYKSDCYFGFPEPKKEGHLFAALCSFFAPADETPVNTTDNSLNPASPASPS